MSTTTKQQETQTSPSKWEELRKPFPKEVVGLLPKLSCTACSDEKYRVCPKHTKSRCADCGNWISNAHIHLDYVGHAAVTDRLNTVVGPENWSLEPVAFDEAGNPVANAKGEMWFKLTILGASKLCVGDNAKSAKELIGDALRNGAMRFGVALDLWSKEELESTLDAPELKNEKPTAALNVVVTPPEPYQPPTVAEVDDKLDYTSALEALRIRMAGAGLLGDAATNFIQAACYKKKPINMADIDKINAALDKRGDRELGQMS